MLPATLRPKVSHPPRQQELHASSRNVTGTSADDSLRSRIEQALRNSGYQSLRAIETTVRQGFVYLTGSVGSWYLKQVAQELVMQITGRGCLENNLTVKQGAGEWFDSLSPPYICPDVLAGKNAEAKTGTAGDTPD